jgi:hypothetical protein
MNMAANFIEVFDNALSADQCADLIARFEQSGQALPGRVGGGVMPDLKDSRDIQITGKAEWRDAETALNVAMYQCLREYLRKYPYTLIAPLMLQTQDPQTKELRRWSADDFTAMPDKTLGELIQATLRPGSINLQRYTTDQGGYPYWHCELYPRDNTAETLHRHLLWTIYLNDDFDEGETEFFYQQQKVKPKTGSLLIAPAAFTHTHRGNRPRNGDKYIATSWVLFHRAEHIFGQH